MGNQVPHLGFDGNDFTEPMSKSTEVTYTNVCSCLGTGSISLSVQTDKDTYEVGDSIVITTQVNNQSNKRNICIQLPIKTIQGAKTVEAMQSYAAPLIGPMMQAYGMPQAPGVDALGPETTQEHVTSYNKDKNCFDGNDFAEPMSKSTEVTYTNVCSCLGTGSISLSVQTDKDAYEVGDSIVITTQVNNQSNKRVRAINVYLQRIFSNTFTTIAYIGDINVQATGSFSWNSHLEVPFTPISMHNIGAMNVNVSYFLQVTVVVSSFARNVCIQLPIKIIQGSKTVAAMQSYAAPLLGPMMQAYGMPQAPGVGALGPETTQEHVTSYNKDKNCM